MYAEDLSVGDRVIYKGKCRQVKSAKTCYGDSAVSIAFIDFPEIRVRPKTNVVLPRDVTDLPLFRSLYEVSVPKD